MLHERLLYAPSVRVHMRIPLLSLVPWLLLLIISGGQAHDDHAQAMPCSTGQGDASAGLSLRRVVLPEKLVRTTGAYCNDYTPAHFYVDIPQEQQRTGSATRNGCGDSLSKASNPTKWVIFLEGGGVCQNAVHCWSRYYSSSRRLMTSDDGPGNNAAMSWTFPDQVIGHTMLSRNQLDNPAFHDARRVIVPYCSSDLWVGRSKVGKAVNSASHRQRLQQAAANRSTFGNLLAFRGVAIFRAVFEHVWQSYGLQQARQILLAGSSAGGIGALNQIEWVRFFVHRQQRREDVTLAVMADSSWFVDFRAVLSMRIQPDWLENNLRSTKSDDGMTEAATDGHICLRRLHGVCPVNTSGSSSSTSPSTCGWIPGDATDNKLLPVNFCSLREASYPCCLSLSCVLAYRHHLQLATIPVLALVSRFDAYLPSIAGQQALAVISDQDTRVLQAARLIIEYGAIQFSYVSTRHRNDPFQATILPACTQHVYLATSSLWDADSVLGSVMGDVYGGSGEGAVFSHSINYRLWSSVCVPVNKQQAELYQRFIALSNCQASGSPANSSVAAMSMSLREATTTWWLGVVASSLLSGRGRPFIADFCEGINCNPTCPDGFNLGKIRNDWTTAVDGMTSVSAFTYVLVCAFIVYKLAMKIQRHRLCVHVRHSRDSQSTGLTFPSLEADEALTVSCLKLKYIVLLQHEPGSHELGGSEDQAKNISLESENVVGPAIRRQSMANVHWSSMPRLHIRGAGKRRSPVKVKRREKVILNGLSLKFNPRELIAVMGPSGCGKTTFLELLTGRRKFISKDHFVKGDIFVNGASVRSRSVLDSYIHNAGYVRQLASPYYEELTIRENLILAANLRLADGMKPMQKIEHVEQIIHELGLMKFADTKVGGHTGPGISGGQKRKLCVGLQLIELPKVLFLDEPTSGLDSTSTMELLEVLRKVADSGRLVILSIHQPRLEVVQMFHKILFLCDGQVAFHGPAHVFPGVLMVAVKTEAGQNFAQEKRHVNVADQMMDMLRDPDLSEVFRGYYRCHGSQEAEVRQAVRLFRQKTICTGANPAPEASDRAGLWNRLFVWETRAGWRSSLAAKCYLSIVMAGMSLALAGAYFKSADTLLLLTALCLWSLGSSLFMTPALHYHLLKGLELYELEKHDGVGQSLDIILQTFLRFGFLAAIPIMICTPFLYLMITTSRNISALDIFNLTASYLQLNLSFSAFGIFLISTNPYFGFKLAPLFSCLTGFVGGFMIPVPQMAVWYRWLRFINPNFYAFANVLWIYLDEYQHTCKLQSKLECFTTSGLYFLQRFGFDQTTPIANSLVLFTMTVLFLLLAWLTLEVRMNDLWERCARLRWKGSTRSDCRSDLEESLAVPLAVSGVERKAVTFADFVEGESEHMMRRRRNSGIMVAPAVVGQPDTSWVSQDAQSDRTGPATLASVFRQASNDQRTFSLIDAGNLQHSEAEEEKFISMSASIRRSWRYIARQALAQSRGQRGMQLSTSSPNLHACSTETATEGHTLKDIGIRAARSDQHLPFSTGKSSAALLFQTLVQNALTAKKDDKDFDPFQRALGRQATLSSPQHRSQDFDFARKR